MAVEIGTFPYRRIFKWNGGTTKMQYEWKGKLWLNPHPLAWPWVRVRALDFADLTITFFADGVFLMDKIVTSAKPFRLPERQDYNEIEYVITGTSTVRSVEVAQNIEELT